MKLVKDKSVGAYAIQVPCVSPDHYANNAKRRYPRRGIMFTLAEGFFDIDGKAFVDYYCDDCVNADPNLRKYIV